MSSNQIAITRSDSTSSERPNRVAVQAGRRRGDQPGRFGRTPRRGLGALGSCGPIPKTIGTLPKIPQNKWAARLQHAKAMWRGRVWQDNFPLATSWNVLMQDQQRPLFPVPAVDDRIIYDLRFQYRAVPMVALAQEMGLFEALAEGPLGFDEVARATGTKGRVTETMLAVATSFGLLEREAPAHWRLSAVARTYLLESSPFFNGPLLGADDPGLAELRRACLDVRGPTQALSVAMKELSDDEIRVFIARMYHMTLPAASALGRNERFQSVKRLLDLAGGSGSLSIGIAAQNASLKATLFDLPRVCAIASQNIRDFGLEDRVTTHDGDMFNDPWPKGHDGILFGNIFHDWNEEDCQFLAERAFDALEPGGPIFLHEVPLQPGKDGPLTAAALSVAMILHEHGRQYTVEELHAFLGRAGFVDPDASPSFGYYWLISAHKPSE